MRYAFARHAGLMAFRHRLALTGALLASLSACSTHATEHVEPTKPEPIAECESYGVALRACTAKLGPSAARLTQNHVAFVAQAVAPAANERARAELRDQCVAATARLSASCR